MKKLAVGLLLLMGMGTVALGQNKDFYNSGQILAGEVWNQVNIYGNDTVVDMLGGEADNVNAWNSSTFNMSAGQTGIQALDSSTVNVSGGYCSSIYAFDTSALTIDESADVLGISARENSTLHLLGGTIDHLSVSGSSVAHLDGSTFIDTFSARENSIVNVYGTSLVKTNSGGTEGFGMVSGQFSDGTPFTVSFGSAETYQHVVLVPEPCAVIVLMLGGIRLIKRN